MPVSEFLPCDEPDGLVSAQAFALLRARRSLTRSKRGIFVPHGEPEPTEWLASHPDYIKLPATFVPRTDGDGGTEPSSGSPPAGQRRTIDGLAPPPDPAAPWRPTENAVPNATQAGTHESSDRTFIGADPVAAYCRANEALPTAAGRHVSEHAVASNPPADVGNAPADRTAPSSSLAEQVTSAIWHDIISPAEAKEALPAQAVHQQNAPPSQATPAHSQTIKGEGSYYPPAGRSMANRQPYDPSAITAAMLGVAFGTVVTVTLADDPGRSITVTATDRGPYVTGRVIDLGPAAFTALVGSLAPGVVQVVVTVP